MRYVSVKDVRVYNGWMPIEEKTQPLKKVGETFFQTPHTPLVDADWDNTVIDDVAVFLNGERIEPESVDPDTGLISVYPPVSDDAEVEASYFWHPVGDGDITLAVEAAEALVEALTGTVYAPHNRVERIVLKRGNTLRLSEPIISIESVKTYDSMGTLVGEEEVEVVDAATSIIRLKGRAAEPRPPWFLPSTLEVEVRYVAGYEQVPAAVKNCVLALASYNLLTRFQHRLVFSADYGKTVSAAFSAEELEKRLGFLKAEVEKTLNSLPRRVEKV